MMLLQTKMKLPKACNNVTAIEHKADEYYYIAIAELFDKEKDAAELSEKQ